MFKEGEGMKLKIPIEVDFDDIQSLFDDINHLQTYKLFEGSDELMVCLEDVADVLVKHIKAKEKRQSDHIAEVSKKGDLISRQALLRQIDIDSDGEPGYYGDTWKFIDTIKMMPSAQPEYEPVTAEDFAKTMSENTIYRYMAWYGEALALMKEQGFVICKRTM